jgi:hypothetical protein
VVQCKLLASKKKIIYEIIRNRKSIRKQRDKLTSYFKLAKKIKRISKWLHSSCYDSPIRRKRRRQIMGIFAGKCDRNADMWLTYLCSEHIFWVQIVKYENLCKGIKEYGEI